jgi:hypothetical protein
MNDGSFLFGVEIELFLGSRKQKNPTFKSLAEEVNKRLTKAGIANHIKASNDKSASKYRKWSLVQEVSIPPSHDHCKSRSPASLCSPVSLAPSPRLGPNS